MIEVDRVNDPKKKRVQMVLCWNFIETTPTLPKWLLCLKHVDHCARDLGCSVNHELINQLMKFGTPWAGGLLIRGRALPKDHFFSLSIGSSQSQVPRRLWLQCGCRLEVVPGLSTLIVLSYVARFYAFFPPDVIMILFFWFEAWHSAAAREAFMLWLAWNGAFGWFCWCGQGILKRTSLRSSSMSAISGLGLDRAFGSRKKTIEDLPKRRKGEREGAVNPCQVSQMVKECSSKMCLIYLDLSWTRCEQCGPLWSAMCSEQFILRILQRAAVSKVVLKTCGQD